MRESPVERDRPHGRDDAEGGATLDERFHRITTLAASHFGVPVAIICLHDAGGRHWCPSHHGIEHREELREAVAFCERAAGTGTVVVEDAWLDARLARDEAVMGPAGVRFYAGRPLTDPDGRPIGRLDLLDVRPHRLGRADLDLFEALGDWAEAEMVVRRVSRESGAVPAGEPDLSASALLVLEGFHQALNLTDRDLDAVLDVVVEHLAGPGDIAAILLLSDDGKWLEVNAARAERENLLESHADEVAAAPRIPVDGPLVGSVARATEPYVLDRAGLSEVLSTMDPDVQPGWAEFIEERGVHSYVGVPLRVRGTTIGILTLQRTRGAPPHTPAEIAFAQLLADRAAPVIAFAHRDAALRESEARFRHLADNASDIVYRYRVTPTLVIEYLSPSTEHLTGYRPQEFYDDSNLLYRMVHPEDRDTVRWAMENPAEAARRHLTVRWVRRDGGIIWTEHRSVLLYDDHGEPVAVQGIARDVTDLKQSQDELAHQATHDALTGLANRHLFVTELALVLRRLERSPGTVGVLLIDLDRFKVVNDSLGHSAGDRLLVAVADRLRQVLRPSDVPARLGGDEFAVLITDAIDHDAPLKVARRIQAALREPFSFGTHESFATASIGVASTTDASEDPADLLRHADVAMYRAKSAGRSRYEVFDERLRTTTSSRLQKENDLHRALDRDELRVVYQPIFDLATGDAVAVEALVRWVHDGELRGPAHFIDLAEDTGLIVPIGMWVLEQACRQAGRWGPTRAGRPLIVHVNLSARQLASPDLPGDVVAAVRSADVEDRMCLEVTESALMDEPAVAAERLHELRAAGIALALDDFGTGYSSLSYLQRFPFDRLKIDRSFVSGLGAGDDDERGNDAAIVQAITTLAHLLDMVVTAEGVETDAQRRALRALGCEEAQGFLLAHPTPAEEIDRLLAPAGRGGGVTG